MTNLPPGEFVVTETQPVGLGNGVDRAHEHRGGAHQGRPVTDVDFTERGSAVGGYVFFDANDNGSRDPAEKPIAGVQITLTGTDLAGKSIELIDQDEGGRHLQLRRPGRRQVRPRRDAARRLSGRAGHRRIRRRREGHQHRQGHHRRGRRDPHRLRLRRDRARWHHPPDHLNIDLYRSGIRRGQLRLPRRLDRLRLGLPQFERRRFERRRRSDRRHQRPARASPGRKPSGCCCWVWRCSWSVCRGSSRCGPAAAGAADSPGERPPEPVTLKRTYSHRSGRAPGCAWPVGSRAGRRGGQRWATSRSNTRPGATLRW